jgi:phosphotransferase system enzyme I (PtsI)
MFSEIPDELIRERAADLKDVRVRLLRCWANKPENNLATLDKPYIVAAEDLFPSDTATLDREKVLAIITEMEAPPPTPPSLRAVRNPRGAGRTRVAQCRTYRMPIVVDAIRGDIFVEPSEEIVADYTKKRDAYRIRALETKRFLDKKRSPRTASMWKYISI